MGCACRRLQERKWASEPAAVAMLPSRLAVVRRLCDAELLHGDRSLGCPVSCCGHAPLGFTQDVLTRRPTSDIRLRLFLDETYEAWMKSTYAKRTTEVTQTRSASRD